MIPRVALTAVLLLAWADSTAAESDWSYRGRLEAGSRHYLVDRDRGLKDDNIVLEGELEAWAQVATSMIAGLAEALALVTFPRPRASRVAV